MSIIIAILIFGLIIAIHELGHFLVAKACNVKVNEFAIGMGPAIWKKTKGETKYALRLFPIGGFCAMEGEDESSDDERALNKKPVWQRILICVAGAVMNLILGLVVVLIMVSMSRDLLSTRVGGFHDNATSSETGLQIGDKIVKVNGMRIFTTTDLSYKLMTDDDGIYEMQVIRDGKKVNLSGVKLVRDNVADGKGTIHVDFLVQTDNKNFFTVISHTFKNSYSTARMIWISLGDLIKGKYGINDMSGPVGIVTVIGDAMDSSVSKTFYDMMQNLLYLVALITINVGLFNLLPLPALDGGRIVFLIIEAIRGKPIKPEHEGIVHFVGLALLMVLMVIVTFNDIVKLF
jgi:regulator of sigma E protease